MAASDFDSQAYAKRLQDAGEPPAAAEVHADVVGEVMREVVSVESAAKRFRAEREKPAGTDLESAIDQANSKSDHNFDQLNRNLDQLRRDLNTKIENAIAELRSEQMIWNIILYSLFIIVLASIP